MLRPNTDIATIKPSPSPIGGLNDFRTIETIKAKGRNTIANITAKLNLFMLTSLTAAIRYALLNIID